LFVHALVGVDLSKVSDVFVQWLPSLKAIETRQLTLVYVIPLEVVDHVAGFDVEGLLSSIRREALEKLEKYAEYLEDQGFSVDFKIVGPSIPAHRLAKEAEKVKADYIVVASRGHGWLRSLLLGSTVEELLHVSSKPVFVSKPYRHNRGDGVELRPPVNPFMGRPILAAVDFDEYLDAVLSCGAEIARKSKADLYLLHVVEAENEEARARERLARLARSLASGGEIVINTIVQRGRPQKVVLDYARRIGSSLIIIGGSMGSVAEYVVRRSHTHILACK
jgi:nucleotide-binding universal stress UspA family protein